MREWSGLFFPDGERHLIDWMKRTGQLRDGVPQYQFHKYAAAMRWVRDRRAVAIDVGAHIGQWSSNMAKDFERVVAFEPVPAYQECWRRNMSRFDNAELQCFALGRAAGSVSLRAGTPGSFGDTFVVEDKKKANAARNVKMRTLDSFPFSRVDFVKIDCEGYEENVVAGGREMLLREKPCVVVEQKSGHSSRHGLRQGGAVDLLRSMGAKVRSEISGDYIMSW